jgi:hypothetical protein
MHVLKHACGFVKRTVLGSVTEWSSRTIGQTHDLKQ